jgi:hypothetical protein
MESRRTLTVGRLCGGGRHHISGPQEDALNADMPEDVSVAIPATALFTDAGKAKSKAIKDNKKGIAYYATTWKQMKLLRLLTKAKKVFKCFPY